MQGGLPLLTQLASAPSTPPTSAAAQALDSAVTPPKRMQFCLAEALPAHTDVPEDQPPCKTRKLLLSDLPSADVLELWRCGDYCKTFWDFKVSKI